MKALLLAAALAAGLHLPAQEVAFRSVEKDLILEGIAFDAASGVFFVSSIFKNKIVAIAKDNEWRDFFPGGSHRFAGGVGLHADAKRRILWACSGNIMGERFRTGVFAFDLDTRKLIRKFFLAESTAPRFFNDLVIDKQGAVFITDTMDHSIWKWDLVMAAPVKLALKERIEYPNGIAISPDGRFLFVATREGLKRIALRGLAVEPMPLPPGPFSSTGLDGIAFFRGSLIAVQNGSGKAKILRYHLSGSLERVERVELLDMDNRNFAIPTTLAIAHGCLYVVANSQLLNLDQEKLAIINPALLAPSVILKYELD